MRFAYADPPYPGMSAFYRDHPDFGGEVDHSDLIAQMEREYDGWCLHTASTTLLSLAVNIPDGVRVMAWVKPFAAFKKNVHVAYAWEPVLVKPLRNQRASTVTSRDWFAEPMTMKRGLTGAKPDAVCKWLFEVAGLDPDDELVDLYPGTGAVTRAWEGWRSQLSLLSPVGQREDTP